MYERKVIKQLPIEIMMKKKSQLNSSQLQSVVCCCCCFFFAVPNIYTNTHTTNAQLYYFPLSLFLIFVFPFYLYLAYPKNWMDYFFFSLSFFSMDILDPATGKNSYRFFSYVTFSLSLFPFLSFQSISSIRIRFGTFAKNTHQ